MRTTRRRPRTTSGRRRFLRAAVASLGGKVSASGADSLGIETMQPSDELPAAATILLAAASNGRRPYQNGHVA
ncbi:MAG: hypothetical protein AAGF31_02425 [Planctomycetota bacterium]